MPQTYRRRMSLRPCALSRHRRSRHRHNLQLLDLHQEGDHASDRPAEQFELISGKDDLTTYEFNTRTAKHTFCKVCGIHPFYIPRSDPDKIDVNARCLDGIDLAAIRPKYFDGKHWEEAIEKDVPWR